MLPLKILTAALSTVLLLLPHYGMRLSDAVREEDRTITMNGLKAKVNPRTRYQPFDRTKKKQSDTRTHARYQRDLRTTALPQASVAPRGAPPRPTRRTGMDEPDPWASDVVYRRPVVDTTTHPQVSDAPRTLTNAETRLRTKKKKPSEVLNDRQVFVVLLKNYCRKGVDSFDAKLGKLLTFMKESEKFREKSVINQWFTTENITLMHELRTDLKLRRTRLRTLLKNIVLSRRKLALMTRRSRFEEKARFFVTKHTILPVVDNLKRLIAERDFQLGSPVIHVPTLLDEILPWPRRALMNHKTIEHPKTKALQDLTVYDATTEETEETEESDLVITSDQIRSLMERNRLEIEEALTYEMADGDNWDAARIEHERANAHCEWDEEGHQEQIALEHQRDIVKYKIQKNVYGISRRQGNRRGGYAVRRNDGLRAAQ
eukprot:Lankesteria_metandrocarpae@DN5377_c0_g1_i15.p1